MIKMNLQYFGGRGTTSGGTGGVSGADIVSTRSLISAEGKRSEIDQTLQVLRDVEDQYGVILEDVQLATLKGAGKSALAYYDNNGNLAVNESYFDGAKMDAAYDRCVDIGFHPSRGPKTGLEAVTAHEMGHRLTDIAGVNAGLGPWQLDRMANKIVGDAAAAAGAKNVKSFMARVSGYASENAAECVAEAFADVYCNGPKASKASQAIVRELNKSFGR